MHTILIADDHADIRLLVRMTLLNDHFELLEARSGEEVLDLARNCPPSVVLLDISMPGGIDGVETCRRLRAEPATATTKVIMLTAAGQDADRARANHAGADGYFVKPFSPVQLLDAIYDALGIDRE